MAKKRYEKKDLQQLTGISAASVTKLGKNMNTEIIKKICVTLQCDVGAIMKIVDED